MGMFSKFLSLAILGCLIAVPYAASRSGWGLGSEADPQVVSQVTNNCPPGYRDRYGKCRRSHRSYFYGRSLRGGGPGRGK